MYNFTVRWLHGMKVYRRWFFQVIFHLYNFLSSPKILPLITLFLQRYLYSAVDTHMYKITVQWLHDIKVYPAVYVFFKQVFPSQTFYQHYSPVTVCV
jgi:hypothetical protein